MAKYLLIVESPEKAKKIAGYLGKDYRVIASVGHVIDLPAKGLNVNIKKNFEPNYDIMPGKEAVVASIVEASKSVDLVYLMSDPDREGEAIAFHLSKQLPKGKLFKRAKTNSITKQAVEDAIKNASDIDYELVDSYETRRVLDRLVGYKCSFITTSATGGKSAGRVQSAALRVIAEREKEIKAFVPVEYWDIGAELLTNKKEKILSSLITPDKMDIKNKDQADKIVKDLTKKIATVTKYDSKEVFASPRAPFTTSTLQQTSASILGWDQEKTMRVAQRLYEEGRITYHRTDSVSIIPQFLAATRDYISNAHAPEYLPKTVQVYASNGNHVQGAHEAIRPVDVTACQIVGEADERKLYDVIWRRTVSSQMEKAKNLSVSARFTVDSYELGANGNVSLFDGWKKVWHWSVGEDKLLPVLKVGDKCDIIDVTSEQKFTQPPSRYTKSSITKMYEETGIGRPSTYATITKILRARNYIELNGNSYVATPLGIRVCDFLVNSNFCFIDLDFTSKLEEKLDKIGEKELKKLGVLEEFWSRLSCDLTNAATIKKNLSVTDIDCPTCKKQKLLSKNGKFGPFFACPDKECGFTANIGEDGKPKEKLPPKPKEYVEFKCKNCGSRMIKRSGKFGEFAGCEKFPNCKTIADLQGKFKENTGKTFKKRWAKKAPAQD